jgi:hypothetical protein
VGLIKTQGDIVIKTKRLIAGAVTTCTGLLAIAVPAYAANPGTGTTTDTLPVSVTISSPLDGATYPLGATVDVTGQVSIGSLSTAVNVTYVVDQSGSTSGDGGPCGDANNDGSPDEIIDCEIVGVQTLNNQLVGKPGVNVGLVPFSSGGSIAVPFTTPADPAVNAALTALVPTGGTNFDDALAKTVELNATAPVGNRKVVYFFSDGDSSLSTGAGSALDAAVAAGLLVNTFSVGEGAAPCEVGESIQEIATATGGDCIEVTDPSQLSTVLEGHQTTGLERDDVSIGGGAPVAATVDALGFFSATVSPVAAGANSVVATAVIDDGTQVSADITVYGPEPTTTTAVAPPTTTALPVPVARAVVVTPVFTG